jgi:transposase
MEVVYRRCCGLDVHKKGVVACAIVPGPGGRPKREVQTFGTMTADLLELSDWLSALKVTHVAMESTGVYWKPIWNVLEQRFELLLANAQHIKAVPGRKTDVKDCEWIADLLRHGLIRGSFVPDQSQRELRELTRYRTSLIRERASEVNRLQKTLEGANIKLASVATDITGKSGLGIMQMLIAGSTDAKAMAQLAKARMREKMSELERALQGQFGAHQRFLLANQLTHVSFLDATIADLDTEIRERTRLVEEEIGRMDEIPGIGRRTAEVIVAEVGTDMNRFPSDAHLASWAGMCPGNHESAGKQRSGRIRRGNPWLRAALAEAAQAAGRSKSTYLSSQYHRLVSRRGNKKACIAVGHTMLISIYHMLKANKTYDELGASFFDELHRQSVQKRAIDKLQALGYSVVLQPA